MKYCMECGQQIPIAAKFCPNCGAKQATTVTANTVKVPEVDTVKKDNFDKEASKPVDDSSITGSGNIQQELSTEKATNGTTDKVLSVVTKVGVDVGPLMKVDPILAKKAELGYSAKTDNFVYAATPIELKDLLTIKGITGLKSQNYIMCFEDDGILMMGTIGMAKFNDDDHFIKNEQVQDIKLEKRLLQEWDHMFLTVDDEEIELLIQSPTWSVIPWHRRNAKKVLVYTN